ncbi:hypothetical protein MTR67_003658, partial [Solanum verrucosum]
GKRAGASRQPARPKRDSEVQPLVRRSYQSPNQTSLKFEVWRSAPLRAPRSQSLPILSLLSHTCS